MDKLKVMIIDKELEIQKIKQEKEMVIELYNILVEKYHKQCEKVDELEELVAKQKVEFDEELNNIRKIELEGDK